jgi:hypothetical protein
MLQGQQTQQPQQIEPQPAPLYAPEQPEPAFTMDEGAVPLSKVLWKDAKEGFMTGESLLANLKTRSLNTENDLKQKFVGYLLSHRLTRNIGTAAAAFLTPPEKFLTKDEYENSEYKRPGLNFDHGVYENLAKEETQHYDQNQIFQDLNARTTQGTWPTIAKGGAYLIGGFANPLFLEFGGMAGEALAPAATFLTDFLPEIKALSPEAQAGLKAFVGKTIIRGGEMPVFTGLDYAEERAHQEDASIRNILYSIPAGMLFGAAEFGAGKVFGRVFSSRPPELKSDFAEEKGMNEPRPDEPDPIVQSDPVSSKVHEEAFKSGVSQMENGKLPEVSEIVKQNYHDEWQDSLGEKLREDPEQYAKELDDLKKSRDINQAKLDDVNKELEKDRHLKFTIKKTEFSAGTIFPGTLDIADEDLFASKDSTKFFHGTDSGSLLKILKDEKIKPRVSLLDKLKQKVISLSHFKAVAEGFGNILEIDKEGIDAFEAPKEAWTGEVPKGFEFRSKEEIPINKIKKIIITLGKKEDLDTSIFEDDLKIRDLIREANEKGFVPEIWHDEPLKLREKIGRLEEDRDQLLNKQADLDDMIDTRENAPEASNMEDVHEKIAKQHSPQSDFSYFEPKEPVDIPPEAKSRADYAQKMSEDFNAKKAEMSEKTKELANTEDIKEKTKGTNKFLNAIRACLIRGA